VTALTAFYDKVVSDLAGCEPAFALSYIRDAAIEFFQRSRTWREPSAPITLKYAAISGITKANPGVVTATGHPFANGESVLLANVGGMVQVNGYLFTVASAAANTFALGVDTSTFGTFTSGGDAAQAAVLVASPTAGAVISDVTDGANYYGRQVDPLAVLELKERYGAMWRHLIGEPRTVHMTDEAGTCRFVPAPGETLRNFVQLELALKPAQDATTLPDAIYDRYREDIEFGARAKLRALPDKPWSNAEVAMALEAEFNRRISLARNRVMRSRTRGPITAVPVSFETPDW
jgi:hypothetical protein